MGVCLRAGTAAGGARDVEAGGEVEGRDWADVVDGGGADGVGDNVRVDAAVEVAFVVAVGCGCDGGCGLRALRSSSMP